MNMFSSNKGICETLVDSKKKEVWDPIMELTRQGNVLRQLPTKFLANKNQGYLVWTRLKVLKTVRKMLITARHFFDNFRKCNIESLSMFNKYLAKGLLQLRTQSSKLNKKAFLHNKGCENKYQPFNQWDASIVFPKYTSVTQKHGLNVKKTKTTSLPYCFLHISSFQGPQNTWKRVKRNILWAWTQRDRL